MESILKWIYANEQMIYILVLVIFLGFIVISRVPAVLHTLSCDTWHYQCSRRLCGYRPDAGNV